MRPTSSIGTLLTLFVISGLVVFYLSSLRPSVQLAGELVPGPFEGTSFYDHLFESTALLSAQEGVVGVLVNHHLLAPHLIARALSVAATAETITVVLIAPDHFSAGAAPITTTYASFATPYGTLSSVADGVLLVTESGFALAQEEPFHREHGISNITAFITKLMPNARIVPLIVGDLASEQSVFEVAKALGKLSGRVILVGSFDFTHDATVDQAEANDARSIPILEELGTDHIDDISVDSHGGLELFLRAVHARGAEEFILLSSTNSARITGNVEQADVTSYITGYFH